MLIEQVSHEQRIHGTTLFPLAVYPVVLTPGPRQEFVNIHWHEEVEFVLVTKGKVVVQVGAQLFSVVEGEGVFIHSELPHALMAPEEGGESEFTAIVFDMKLLSSSMYDLATSRYVNPLFEHKLYIPTYLSNQTIWETQILSYTKDIITSFLDQQSGYEIAIKGYIYLIMAVLAKYDAFMQNSEMSREDTLKLQQLKRVLSYIDEHMKHKITLEDLAALLPMSKGHFCRFFKQMTQKRPMQYIIDLRINRAAKLLRETDWSILEIGLEVGFEDLSYFIKTFRESKNCTPKQFRTLL